MNGYLLDTNIPSELTRDRPDPHVSAFLRELNPTEIFLSVLTIGEISKGIAIVPPGPRRDRLQRWLEQDLRSWFGERIIPVTEPVAELWGRMAGAARLQGKPLAVVDGLIAATASHHRLIVVTRNTADFKDLGLSLVNPWLS